MRVQSEVLQQHVEVLLKPGVHRAGARWLKIDVVTLPMRLVSQTPAVGVLEYLYFTSPSQSMWSADWLTEAFGLQPRQYFLSKIRKLLGVIHEGEGSASDACLAQLF